MDPAPEHPAQAMEGGAMSGDEGIGAFGDGGEAGQMAVESKPKPFARCVAQREKTRLGRAGAAPVRGQELHRPPELIIGDRWMLRRDLLVGPIFDLVAGQFLPVAGPIGAEPAIAVIDELRARAGGLRVSGGFGRWDSGAVWHDIRDG